MKFNRSVAQLVALLAFAFLACTAEAPGCDCNAHGSIQKSIPSMSLANIVK